MRARNEVDKKNERRIQELLIGYPNLLKSYVTSINDKTSYTKLVYVRYIGHFLDYVKNTLKLNINNTVNYTKIKPMNISDYMETIKYDKNGKEKSVSYYNTQLSAIKSYFDFLENNEIVKNNPCKKIKQLKDNKEHEIVTITEEDYNIMINNIKNGVGNHKARAIQKKWISRDMALLTLGLTTGLRVSAIVGIDIDDIDFDNRLLKVTEKGNKERKIYLGIKTLRVLHTWMEERKTMVGNDEKALFISKNYKRISSNAVEERFRMICQGTKKRITPHKMRATCATTLYEKTGDIYLVQKQLGHKNIENTKRYAKMSENKMKEAANILNDLF